MNKLLRWQVPALVFIALGVPALACGGRVLGESVPDGGSSATTSSRPVPTGSASTTASTSATGGSSSSTASGSSSFGGFPCTANTAIHNECPSTAASGCQYWVGSMGINPAPGAQATTGCKLELVYPTSPGGATCERVDCVCTSSGHWEPGPDCEEL